MFDLQRIPMSRVRWAYGLNPHKATGLIQVLCPHAVFPLELWSRAYELFWQDFVRTEAMKNKVEYPALPDIILEPGNIFHTDLCALDVMTFFRKLSVTIHSGPHKKGLEYILAETFDTFDGIYSEERAELFRILQKLEQREPEYDMFDVENMNDEILCLPASGYDFISHIFFDTILVDRVAVVLHLRDYPLLHEVKGLSHAFVKYVLNSLNEGAQDTIVDTKLQKQPAVPRSTGSKKDSERIKMTRRVCEKIVEELHSEKDLFEGDKSNWKQCLIFDNGKTNWKTFLSAVETRLGSKPHHDAAREVWKHVPDNFKHNGRMREQ